jgi:hypothetical protein
MALSTRAKHTASILINKYGNSGSLVSVVLGVYDPVLGERAETTTSIPIRYTLRRYSLKEIETGLVSAHDVELMFVSDIPIDETYRFVINDGSTVNLTNITKVEVQDLVVIYKCTGVANA